MLHCHDIICTTYLILWATLPPTDRPFVSVWGVKEAYTICSYVAEHVPALHPYQRTDKDRQQGKRRTDTTPVE